MSNATQDASLAIEQVSHLRDLEASLRGRLAACASLRRVKRGGHLFGEGETSEGLFIVVSGELKLMRAGPDQREQIFYIARRDRLIVEGLRFDEAPYAVNAVAIRASSAWLLRNADLRAIGSDSPALLMRLLNLRARRADRNLALIADLSLRTVPERLAAFIRTQVALLEAEGQHTMSFPRILTTETVAGRLGTVREEVSRGLAMLERSGALKVSPQVIEVVDLERLERHAYGETKQSVGRVSGAPLPAERTR